MAVDSLQKGFALHQAGRLAEAEAAYKEVIRAQPGHLDATHLLGVIAHQVKKYPVAIEIISSVIEAAPQFAEAHFNLANALHCASRIDEAVAHYKKAIELKPGFPEPLHRLAALLVLEGCHQEALEYYERHLALVPYHAESSFARAFLKLLMDDYAEGWKRFDLWDLKDSNKPKWNGEDIGDRTLLLIGDMGLGDIALFVRYANLIKGKTIVAVEPPLIPLLRDFNPCDSNKPVPPFDLYCPLSKLPGIFKTTIDTIPPVPYLYPDERLVEQCRAILNPDKFSIGIAWQGNPNFAHDHKRSIPLRQFAGLSMPGVELVSLQRGFGAEQIESAGFPVKTWGGGEGFSYADTAAMMKALDLVITTDSSIANVAGAIGANAWVLIPAAPDWRWGLDREYCPWYPSLRLFRQARGEEWVSVLSRVAAELSRLVLSPSG